MVLSKSWLIYYCLKIIWKVPCENLGYCIYAQEFGQKFCIYIIVVLCVCKSSWLWMNPGSTWNSKWKLIFRWQSPLAVLCFIPFHHKLLIIRNKGIANQILIILTWIFFSGCFFRLWWEGQMLKTIYIKTT